MIKHSPAMEEEKRRLLEKAITKAKVILDGYAVNEVFSSEEYVTNYDCVYYLGCRSLENQCMLRDVFKRALQESITSKVYPSVMDKIGVPLLREFLRVWTNYKIMSKCLRGFFHYLDRSGLDRTGGLLLSDMSICCFHDLVYIVLHQRLTDATLLLMNQDRHMVPIDENLLQDFFRFYAESGEQGNKAYHAIFEAILADAATHYSRVATKLYPILSSANYVLMVEQFKLEEKRRATMFLDQPSVEMLLRVIHSQMLEKYADELSEKRTAEDINSMVYQVSAMRVGEV